ncbi:MAG: zeta toxin family protein [Bacteroidota bacterium]|nr:zeta toxin family protein [Bacteroidota bacterium]
MPSIYIIAGCNGAGKTTAAYNLLPEVFKTIEFVNADEIARGLSPLNPEGVAFHAARIMLERLEDLKEKKKNFAFETTLSGLTYLKFIRAAKLKEYNITLFFIWLNNAKLAKERVAARVSKGGHNIPENVIERRYAKGVNNFSKYFSLADDWYIYDNSGTEYTLVAKGIAGQADIFNFDVYNNLNTK